MYAREILGTLLTVFFIIFVAILIKLLWVNAIAPLWVAIVTSAVFGGVAIWAIIKVGSWWYQRIKNHFNKKK